MFNRAALQRKDGITERRTSDSWTIQYPEMSHGLINGLALATSLRHIVLIRPKNPNCISHDKGNNKLFQSRLSSCIQNKTTPSDFAANFCEVINRKMKHKLLPMLPNNYRGEEAQRVPTRIESILSLAMANQPARAVNGTVTRVLSNAENKKPSA